MSIRRGLRRTMVDGTSTLISTYPWIDSIPISMWPTFVNTDLISNLQMVSELLLNGFWDFLLLSNCFHPVLIDRILCIDISSSPGH